MGFFVVYDRLLRSPPQQYILCYYYYYYISPNKPCRCCFLNKRYYGKIQLTQKCTCKYQILSMKTDELKENDRKQKPALFFQKCRPMLLERKRKKRKHTHTIFFGREERLWLLLKKKKNNRNKLQLKEGKDTPQNKCNKADFILLHEKKMMSSPDFDRFSSTWESFPLSGIFWKGRRLKKKTNTDLLSTCKVFSRSFETNARFHFCTVVK